GRGGARGGRPPGSRRAGRPGTRPPKGAIVMTKPTGRLRYRRRPDVMDLLARACPASLDPGQDPQRQAAEIARLAAAGTAPAGTGLAGAAPARIAPARGAPARVRPARVAAARGPRPGPAPPPPAG